MASCSLGSPTSIPWQQPSWRLNCSWIRRIRKRCDLAYRARNRLRCPSPEVEHDAGSFHDLQTFSRSWRPSDVRTARTAVHLPATSRALTVNPGPIDRFADLVGKDAGSRIKRGLCGLWPCRRCRPECSGKHSARETGATAPRRVSRLAGPGGVTRCNRAAIRVSFIDT